MKSFTGHLGRMQDLGVVAFGISTAGGLWGGNVMCKLTGRKVNPLIGSAGVSAVPMAARVSNTVGQKNNPSNFLLMHAMGPNVAGVIGSALAAGSRPWSTAASCVCRWMQTRSVEVMVRAIGGDGCSVTRSPPLLSRVAALHSPATGRPAP